MNKLDIFYDKVLDIIAWAERQDHITEEQGTLLAQNITTAKENIEKEQ